MVASSDTVLALDVGERRIGVALAHSNIGIANPLTTLEQSEGIVTDIKKLIENNQVAVLVVGLPRGLEGQETAQTKTVRAFAARLQALGVPIVFQDEALTSRQAEAELQARRKPYAKGDIDALAATYILEDYLAAHRPRSTHV